MGTLVADPTELEAVQGTRVSPLRVIGQGQVGITLWGTDGMVSDGSTAIPLVNKAKPSIPMAVNRQEVYFLHYGMELGTPLQVSFRFLTFYGMG